MNILKNLNKILTNIAIPVLLFGFITFVFYPNLFTQFNSSIEKNDGRLIAWLISWDIQMIFNDPLGVFDANIFYPNKNTLAYSEHFIGGSILATPVFLLSGGSPVASFNFLMITGFVLNAFSGFVLSRYLTKNYYASLIGGIIMGFASYRVISYAHLQNMLVFYIPFAILALIKFKETKQKRWLVLLGFCLFMQSFTSWYHMVFIFLAIGLFILYYYLYTKELVFKDFKYLLSTFIIVIALLLPFAVPYLKFSSESEASYSIADQKAYSADFGGYLLPPPNTIIEDKITSEIGIQKVRWAENINFLGYSAIFLAVIGIFSFDRRSKLKIKINKKILIFGLVLLVFGILSFGPFLHLFDKQYRIPLPYLLIYYIAPPLRFIRAVSRYSTVVVVMLSVLSSFGYVKIINRLKTKSKVYVYVLTLLIGFIILFEYYPATKLNPQVDVENPLVYEYIKDSEDIVALVELPIHVDPFVTTGYIYNAGIHFKPIVNGYSGYQPPEYIFTQLILKDNASDIGLKYLYDLGVSHVLINPGFEIVDNIHLETVYKADGYTLYRINSTVDNISGVIDFFNNTYTYESQLKYTKDNVEIYLEGDEIKPYPRISLLNPNTPGELKISSSKVIKQFRFNAIIEDREATIKVECGAETKNFSEIITDQLLTVECNSNEIEVKIEGSASITRLSILNGK